MAKVKNLITLIFGIVCILLEKQKNSASFELI